MIDWFNVAANSLWILGCAVALATLSYASWYASVYHEKLRQTLGGRNFQVSLNAAGVLFCLGLAATSGKVWEIILWAVLAVVFIVQIVILLLPTRDKP